MPYKLNTKTIIASILIIGTILRFYNIGFEDLWYDEIISFWVGNPNHSFLDSFRIHNYIERSPYTYHFFLKFFFEIFGYNLEVGRCISAFFGSLCILTIPYIARILKYEKAYLFSLFLISFNIFLISFSQEMRVYSMLLFFISLSYIFFFQIIINNSKYLYFIIFSLIAIFLHPFALLIYFSFIFYLFLRYLKFKEINLNLNLSLIFIGFISVLFYYFSFIYFLEPSNYDHFWIPQIEIKFFTNFFFSQFFGSRLLGIIFLFFLIFLVIRNLKSFAKLDNLSILLISIIISYFLPIMFNYIFEPVLVSRYLIFVLIPIILLIAILSYKFEDKKISLTIVSFLCIITILNMFTEQTFKQFYNPRAIYKPEYSKALIFIEKSNHKKYSLKIVDMKSMIETTNSINNYIDYIGSKNNLKITYISLKEIDNSAVWVICPMYITKDCSLPKIISNYQIINEKYFNSLNLKLIKKT